MSAETSERRPPGVLLPRENELGEPRRAGQSREGVLVLYAPLRMALAKEAVRDFLRAAVAEKAARFELLLAPEAFVETGAGRQLARPFWQGRLAQLDYSEVRGELLFRDAEVQTYRAADMAQLPASRRGALQLAPDEVAVRVPIRISWAGRTRLFGDELLFRLRPLGNRFEIAEISEDFRLP